MQLTALTLALALFYGTLAQPVVNDLQVSINGQLVNNGLSHLFASIPGIGVTPAGVVTNTYQQMGQSPWVRNDDILEDSPTWLMTVDAKDFCGWVYIPPSGSQPDEQCALVPQAPFSTPAGLTGQKLCVPTTGGESAQRLCDNPQPQGQVGVMVTDIKSPFLDQPWMKPFKEFYL
ncbi:hypothetical protein H4R35_007249, partial [Dimargaris xerosporica]